MKYIRLLLLVLSVVGFIGVVAPSAYAVNVTDAVCEQAQNPKPPACADISAQGNSSSNPLFGPDGVVTKGINIFTAVIGVVAVVMILISGVRFILSSGDSATTTSARNGIIFAAVGLVIVAAAQLIVALVLKKL